MIEHHLELLLGHVNIGVEHGETVGLLDLVLHGAHGPPHVVLVLPALVDALRQPVHADVDVHLVAVGVGPGRVAQQAPGHGAVDVGADPEGVDSVVLRVADVERLGHAVGRYKEVLRHVGHLRQLAGVLGLAQLEE